MDSRFAEGFRVGLIDYLTISDLARIAPEIFTNAEGGSEEE